MRGQDIGERRILKRSVLSEFRSGSQQQATALAYIIGDIGEIVLRQNPGVMEPVENDQIELFDLVLKQFLDGEGDQARSESGVPSSLSGGRRIVKCTRSTEGSALSKRRQIRSP